MSEGCIDYALGEFLKKQGIVCNCAQCKAERAATGMPEPPEPPAERLAGTATVKKEGPAPHDRIRDAAGDRED